MAFDSFSPLAIYPADGETVVFPIPEQFYDAGDIKLFSIIDGLEESISTDDFSVQITSRSPTPPYLNSGNVVFNIAPVNGNIAILIWPDSDQDQPFEGRPVTPRQRERVHDRHAMRDAVLREFFFRGYRSPLDAAPGLRFIEAGEPGRVATWDEGGNLVEGPLVSEVNTVSQFIDQVVIVAGIRDQILALEALDTEIVALYGIRVAISGVYAIRTSVTTVAGIDDEVVAVAGNATNINAVAAIDTQVSTVAGIAANVTTVAGIAANVTTVAGISADVTTLAPVATQIATLALIDDAISAVAAIDGDVTTVATNIAAVLAAEQNAIDAEAARVGAEAAEQNVALAAVPIGAIIFDATGQGWPGFLELNGSTFDAGTYPDLYAFLGDSNVLPDFTDRVARHAGTLAGAAGSTQDDAMQRITGETRGGIFWNTQGASIGALGDRGNQSSSNRPANGSLSTRGVTFDSANSPGAKVSDDETRVKAVIGKFYIKAYGAFVNEGVADLVAMEQAVNKAVSTKDTMLHLCQEVAATTGNVSQAVTTSWGARALNTVKYNGITGASLLSNQVTLPVGTYIAKGAAPARDCTYHKVRLRDVTNSVTLGMGVITLANATSIGTISQVTCRFTLSAPAVVEFQHIGSTNGVAMNGVGNDVERAADLLIWRVGE